jgi:charged multivesicular body protein 5
MEDLIEQANEIQESLGRSYGVPDEVDEADLQAGECDVRTVLDLV